MRKRPKEVERRVQFKRGECLIRLGGIYMRGRQGQRCVMSLYQEQYIIKLFPEYLNEYMVVYGCIEPI